jgi:hypothetical protein
MKSDGIFPNLKKEQFENGHVWLTYWGLWMCKMHIGNVGSEEARMYEWMDTGSANSKLYKKINEILVFLQKLGPEKKIPVILYSPK